MIKIRLESDGDNLTLQILEQDDLVKDFLKNYKCLISTGGGYHVSIQSKNYPSIGYMYPNTIKLSLRGDSTEDDDAILHINIPNNTNKEKEIENAIIESLSKLTFLIKEKYNLNTNIYEF